jgi:hypothetical protein
MFELPRCIRDLAGLLLNRWAVFFTAVSVDFGEAVLAIYPIMPGRR